MVDCMSFPKEPMEFIKGYSFVDSDEVYTNSAELVPLFRVEQMLEHYHKTYKDEEEIAKEYGKDTNVRSNADRIRSMSDEELAEFICGVFDEDEYNGKYICGVTIANYEQYNILEWLKSEVDA